MTGPAAVTLLGPQRLTPTLPDVVRAAGIDLQSSSCAPMATITAGWQEREDDDRDLVDALLGNTRQPAPVRTSCRHLRARRRARHRPRRARPPAARPPEPVRAPARPRHGRRVRTDAAPRRGDDGRGGDRFRARRSACPRSTTARSQRRGRRRVRRALAARRARRRRQTPRRRGDDPRRIVRPGDRRWAGADATQPDPPARRRRPRRRPPSVRVVGGRDDRH